MRSRATTRRSNPRPHDDRPEILDKAPGPSSIRYRALPKSGPVGNQHSATVLDASRQHAPSHAHVRPCLEAPLQLAAHGLGRIGVRRGLHENLAVEVGVFLQRFLGRACGALRSGYDKGHECKIASRFARPARLPSRCGTQSGCDPIASDSAASSSELDPSSSSSLRRDKQSRAWTQARGRGQGYVQVEGVWKGSPS